MASVYDGLPPVAGDILFFKAGNRWIDQLIIRRTGGDVCHVAVVYSPETIIQAVSGGVQLAPLPGNYGYIAHTGATLVADKPRFDNALAQLRAQVGDRYGFGDIIDQLLNLLPGHPVINFDRSYDCSHLAAAFLDAAGYPLAFGTDSTRLTPEDLKSLLAPEPVIR